MHDFDKSYWEAHWGQDASTGTGSRSLSTNPYLVTQAQNMVPGRALDAGCGTGAEAVWLAQQGWTVTGADISAAALAAADRRGRSAGVADRVDWVEADLTTWQPTVQYDLVSTNYAHTTIPQLELYQRLAEWVAPGGTMLIVGHLHQHRDHDSAPDSSAQYASAQPSTDHAHPEAQHPQAATVTVKAIARLFEHVAWRIDEAEEHVRELSSHGHASTLHDAVVRATRLR